MKKKTIWTSLLLLCLMLPRMALGYEAPAAGAWLDQFAAALAQLSPVNDPARTTDPARAGEVLLEYEFGTVRAAGVRPSSAKDILEIDVRTSQVTDCRGLRVGMRLEDALGGADILRTSTQLAVLGTQDTGCGWQWAYVNGGEIYGVEYIAYEGDGAAMTEYTLTYVIENGMISAIRMKAAPATQAQAEEGLATAMEIASRQAGEVLAMPNGEAMFSDRDLQVMGGDALGRPVYELIAHMGEPESIQTLPQGRGRILIYSDAAVRLGLDEATGVEIVRGVSVTGEKTAGPRRLSVGLSVQEAAALFRCDGEVSSLGGVLYLEGEAAGEPPYGEMIVSGGEMMLIYACQTPYGETAMLEAGVRDGVLTYWHLYFESDAEGGV